MKILQTNIRNANYQKLNIGSLNVGDTLVFNIFIKRLDNYVVIIEAGTTLTDKLYEQLINQEKLYIAKKDKDKQKLTSKTLYAYINHNSNDLKKSLEFLYVVNNGLFLNFYKSKKDIIEMEAIEEIIKSLVYLVNHNQNYLKSTIPLLNDVDALSYHSLHVCIYSISLGHFLNYDNQQLVEIGMAAIMHDLGIQKIDDSIKKKKEKLNVNELEEIHQHSQYSKDIAIKNSINNPYILDAILHHHESYDGLGYPDKLKAEDISTYASILSICDVFNALTNDRSYRKKYTSFEALKIMMKDETMINKFNQKYLQAFLHSFLK